MKLNLNCYVGGYREKIIDCGAYTNKGWISTCHSQTYVAKSDACGSHVFAVQPMEHAVACDRQTLLSKIG